MRHEALIDFILALSDELEIRAKFLRELSLKELKEGRLSPYIDGQAHAYSVAAEEMRKMLRGINDDGN